MFKKGQLVVCINDKNIQYNKPLKEGKIYTIRECIKYDYAIDYSVRLEEIINPIFKEITYEEGGYSSTRFDIIEDTPISITLEYIIKNTEYA